MFSHLTWLSHFFYYCLIPVTKKEVYYSPNLFEMIDNQVRKRTLLLFFIIRFKSRIRINLNWLFICIIRVTPKKKRKTFVFLIHELPPKPDYLKAKINKQQYMLTLWPRIERGKFWKPSNSRADSQWWELLHRFTSDIDNVSFSLTACESSRKKGRHLRNWW